MTTIANLQMIETDEQLTAYLEKLPENTELRFPSATSFTETYGVTVVAYDKEDDTCILVPYFVKNSHDESKDSEKRDTPDLVARFCFYNETGLELIDAPKMLGNPHVVKNLNPDLDMEYFPRYVMIVTSFKGELLKENEVSSQKNGPPVKVDRNLIWRIFEAKTLVADKLMKHRHLYAYTKFIDYMRSEGL